MVIVIVSEFVELALKIHFVPKEHVIEILASNRSDQAFDKGVRDRGVGNGLQFLDLHNAEVCAPAMESKQRVMIRAQILREPLTATA